MQNGTPPFTYVWEHITDVTIFGSGNTILFDNNQISNVPAGIYEINIMDDFGNNVVLFQEVTEPSILAVATDAIDIDGFNLISNKFQEILKANGLKVTEAKIGDVFDAEIHEAITQIPSPTDADVGKIIDIVETGYQLGDRIIRYPKVVVGQ